MRGLVAQLDARALSEAEVRHELAQVAAALAAAEERARRLEQRAQASGLEGDMRVQQLHAAVRDAEAVGTERAEAAEAAALAAHEAVGARVIDDVLLREEISHLEHALVVAKQETREISRRCEARNTQLEASRTQLQRAADGRPSNPALACAPLLPNPPLNRSSWERSPVSPPPSLTPAFSHPRLL